MRVTTKTEEKIRRAQAPASVEARRDDDWLWMVAEDPAFYLEERDGTVAG
jgi:hypothetical protein